jgi:voltage-gated potassium channel
MKRDELLTLKSLDQKLERPMLFLSFVWLVILVIELLRKTDEVLQILGTSLWVTFILYFFLRLLIAPRPLSFLKNNWLFILAMLVPVLRLFPFLHDLPWIRAVTATFGIQVVWILASADQGLRTWKKVMGQQGAGYASVFTTIVIFVGGAGMLHFEKGLKTYADAVWWTAMQITNIGSNYSPVTSGGQILCLAISIYGVAMFGYLTATLSVFLIGQNAEDPNFDSIEKINKDMNELKLKMDEILKRLKDK